MVNHNYSHKIINYNIIYYKGNIKKACHKKAQIVNYNFTKAINITRSNRVTALYKHIVINDKLRNYIC